MNLSYLSFPLIYSYFFAKTCNKSATLCLGVEAVFAHKPVKISEPCFKKRWRYWKSWFWDI